ncbi:aa3-type cytochrome c oxidase subunit IV [Altererythrobacter aerius]|uniref:Aa3-type cytochrome c oxidase subunit IV n=1 Tax=Tsuneonella aeria TaxID=1837929 RepID=A0A6I4TAE7_9SPHN|nr:aa3-type cytochrome c oxidase subunit IV [Tsuneonella aeria]MXO74499.1 aa3-type cytochrome c oxidase subunit IV [Tsuneonella aeria]
MATGNDVNAQDIKEHKGTYGGFVTMLKWTVPITALIVLVIVILIAE